MPHNDKWQKVQQENKREKHPKFEPSVGFAILVFCFYLLVSVFVAVVIEQVKRSHKCDYADSDNFAIQDHFFGDN